MDTVILSKTFFLCHIIKKNSSKLKNHSKMRPLIARMLKVLSNIKIQKRITKIVTTIKFSASKISLAFLETQFLDLFCSLASVDSNETYFFYFRCDLTKI